MDNSHQTEKQSDNSQEIEKTSPSVSILPEKAEEILDARKILEAAAATLSTKHQYDSEEKNDLTSTEIIDLGNLTLFNFENTTLEELHQTATQLTQKLIGNHLNHYKRIGD
jgi:hypothetical protein